MILADYRVHMLRMLDNWIFRCYFCILKTCVNVFYDIKVVEEGQCFRLVIFFFLKHSRIKTCEDQVCWMDSRENSSQNNIIFLKLFQCCNKISNFNKIQCSEQDFDRSILWNNFHRTEDLKSTCYNHNVYNISLHPILFLSRILILSEEIIVRDIVQLAINDLERFSNSSRIGSSKSKRFLKIPIFEMTRWKNFTRGGRQYRGHVPVSLLTSVHAEDTVS